MKPQVKSLKSAAIHACKLRNFPFVEFMEERRLEEILVQGEQENTPAAELAVQVLCECCVTDGQFNNFQVGFLTVLKYLADSFGPLGQGQQQAMTDLASILNTGGQPEAVRQWMKTHYAAP